jgi:serine/threonine protein kinase
VDPAGLVRFTDFGFAPLPIDAAGQPVAGSRPGTLEYTAPEQCRAESLGPETDIYSLGVTLYEMLSGRLPFQGDSPQSIAHQIATGLVEPVTTYNDAIPSAVASLLGRMMNRDRKLRYPDAQSLVSDIMHILQGMNSDTSPSFRGNIHVGTPKLTVPGTATQGIALDSAAGSGGTMLPALGLDRPVMQHRKADRKPINFQGLTLEALIVIIALDVLGGIYSLWESGSLHGIVGGGWVNLLEDESLGDWDNPFAPGNMA